MSDSFYPGSTLVEFKSAFGPTAKELDRVIEELKAAIGTNCVVISHWLPLSSEGDL